METNSAAVLDRMFEMLNAPPRKPTPWDGIPLDTSCVECGERYGNHAWFDESCPHPLRLEIGQPLSLETKFRPPMSAEAERVLVSPEVTNLIADKAVGK